MCSFVGIKSPDPNLPQNSGKKPDISKGIFENGMWKFDSFKVSQTVRQLEIVTSEIPEMPANCCLLQISVPSLSSQFGQSQSEIADSLRQIFEIFPLSGDGGRRLGSHCVADAAVHLVVY